MSESTQVDLKDAIDAELPLPNLQVEAMKLPKINFEMAQQQAQANSQASQAAAAAAPRGSARRARGLQHARAGRVPETWR